MCKQWDEWRKSLNQKLAELRKIKRCQPPNPKCHGMDKSVFSEESYTFGQNTLVGHYDSAVKTFQRSENLARKVIEQDQNERRAAATKKNKKSKSRRKENTEVEKNGKKIVNNQLSQTGACGFDSEVPKLTSRYPHSPGSKKTTEGRSHSNTEAKNDHGEKPVKTQRAEAAVRGSDSQSQEKKDTFAPDKTASSKQGEQPKQKSEGSAHGSDDNGNNPVKAQRAEAVVCGSDSQKKKDNVAPDKTVWYQQGARPKEKREGRENGSGNGNKRVKARRAEAVVCGSDSSYPQSAGACRYDSSHLNSAGACGNDGEIPDLVPAPVLLMTRRQKERIEEGRKFSKVKQAPLLGKPEEVKPKKKDEESDFVIVKTRKQKKEERKKSVPLERGSELHIRVWEDVRRDFNQLNIDPAQLIDVTHGSPDTFRELYLHDGPATMPEYHKPREETILKRQKWINEKSRSRLQRIRENTFYGTTNKPPPEETKPLTSKILTNVDLTTWPKPLKPLEVPNRCDEEYENENPFKNFQSETFKDILGSWYRSFQVTSISRTQKLRMAIQRLTKDYIAEKRYMLKLVKRRLIKDVEKHRQHLRDQLDALKSLQESMLRDPINTCKSMNLTLLDYATQPNISNISACSRFTHQERLDWDRANERMGGIGSVWEFLSTFVIDAHTQQCSREERSLWTRGTTQVREVAAGYRTPSRPQNQNLGLGLRDPTTLICGVADATVGGANNYDDYAGGANNYDDRRYPDDEDLEVQGILQEQLLGNRIVSDDTYGPFENNRDHQEKWGDALAQTPLSMAGAEPFPHPSKRDDDDDDDDNDD